MAMEAWFIPPAAYFVFGLYLIFRVRRNTYGKEK